jgi:hypothetical protein
MAAKFWVELRNANTFQGDKVEGYLGDLGDRGFGPVRDADKAARFDTIREADWNLNKMSDAFFDRYDAHVVEAPVEDAEADDALARQYDDFDGDTAGYHDQY